MKSQDALFIDTIHMGRLLLTWLKLLIHSRTSTDTAVEFWERIGNFTPHFIMDVIT